MRAGGQAPRLGRGARVLSEEEEEDLPDAWESPEGPRELPIAAEFAPEAGLDEERAAGCIRCGNSCRSVYLWQGPLNLFKERDTKRWVEFHDVQTFVAKGPDGKDWWGVKLAQPCRYLIEEEPGKFACAVYSTRPWVCRIYKGVNPDGAQPGCGYHRTAPEA